MPKGIYQRRKEPKVKPKKLKFSKEKVRQINKQTEEVLGKISPAGDTASWTPAKSQEDYQQLYYKQRYEMENLAGRNNAFSRIVKKFVLGQRILAEAVEEYVELKER